MALQFTGQYDLETPANTASAIQSGKTGTSFSCWIQVASGTINVNTNLFGALNAAGLGLYATNDFYWVFENGSGDILLQGAIQFGVPTLIVGTCTTTEQFFYASSGTPAQSGSLVGGPLATATNIKLGVTHPSTSPPTVIISQPAFYEYVLTSSDVLNLLFGNANPLNTGTASLSGGAATWFATLAGTTGDAPKSATPAWRIPGRLGLAPAPSTQSRP